MAVPPLSVSMPALYSSGGACHTRRKVAAADGCASTTPWARSNNALRTFPLGPGRASAPISGPSEIGTSDAQVGYTRLAVSEDAGPRGHTRTVTSQPKGTSQAKGPFVCYRTNGSQTPSAAVGSGLLDEKSSGTAPLVQA